MTSCVDCLHDKGLLARATQKYELFNNSNAHLTSCLSGLKVSDEATMQHTVRQPQAKDRYTDKYSQYLVCTVSSYAASPYIYDNRLTAVFSSEFRVLPTAAAAAAVAASLRGSVTLLLRFHHHHLIIIIF
jgi:hypothetical protein